MSNNLRKIICGFLILVFCIAAYVLCESLWEYHKGDKIYESALNFVAETEDTSEIKEDETISEDRDEKKKTSLVSVSNVKRTHKNIDFTGMQAMNQDVIGWIQILGTQVDYPLVGADDHQYYLKRTYDHRRSDYGSIFLEPQNNKNLNNRHLVIYGHNMVNHAMFGSLINYKKQSFADKYDTITICMPGQDLTYRIFSAYTAEIDSPAYQMEFADDASFENMILHMKENSMIYSGITPVVGDQILTLSTCTPAGDKKYRFVVNAVLINGTPDGFEGSKTLNVVETDLTAEPEEILETLENEEVTLSEVNDFEKNSDSQVPVSD